MTGYRVDVDELAAVLTAMESCGRELADLAGEVEARQVSLHGGWTGLASDAHLVSHAAWRRSFAEMTAALADLRAVGDSARANYSAAVESNVAMWGQLT